MSDDNIIDIELKKNIQYENLEERIYNCFHASIKFDKEHQKNCIYCLHNNATGNMLFEILAKDMTLAAKQKNLLLTTFDMRQVLANVLMKVNQTEYEMEESSSEETGEGRERTNRGFESGKQETSQTDSTNEEGITEIIPFRRSKKED